MKKHYLLLYIYFLLHFLNKYEIECVYPFLLYFFYNSCLLLLLLFFFFFKHFRFTIIALMLHKN